MFGKRNLPFLRSKKWICSKLNYKFWLYLWDVGKFIYFYLYLFIATQIKLHYLWLCEICNTVIFSEANAAPFEMHSFTLLSIWVGCPASCGLWGDSNAEPIAGRNVKLSGGDWTTFVAFKASITDNSAEICTHCRSIELITRFDRWGLCHLSRGWVIFNFRLQAWTEQNLYAEIAWYPPSQVVVACPGCQDWGGPAPGDCQIQRPP